MRYTNVRPLADPHSRELHSGGRSRSRLAQRRQFHHNIGTEKLRLLDFGPPRRAGATILLHQLNNAHIDRKLPCWAFRVMPLSRSRTIAGHQRVLGHYPIWPNDPVEGANTTDVTFLWDTAPETSRADVQRAGQIVSPCRAFGMPGELVAPHLELDAGDGRPLAPNTITADSNPCMCSHEEAFRRALSLYRKWRSQYAFMRTHARYGMRNS